MKFDGWEEWRWVPILNASWNQAFNGLYSVEITGVLEGHHDDWVLAEIGKSMSGAERDEIWGGRFMSICAKVGRHREVMGNFTDHSPQLADFLMNDPTVVSIKEPNVDPMVLHWSRNILDEVGIVANQVVLWGHENGSFNGM